MHVPKLPHGFGTHGSVRQQRQNTNSNTSTSVNANSLPGVGVGVIAIVVIDLTDVLVVMDDAVEVGITQEVVTMLPSLQSHL